jgi:hypothetical protein
MRTAINPRRLDKSKNGVISLLMRCRSYNGDDAAKPAIVLMQAEAQFLDGSPPVSREADGE